MGMFDYYRLKPEIGCPACGASELEWQGKDGACALFVWEQLQTAPIDQMASDDCRLSPDKMAAFRLPVRFEIYAQCGCPTFLFAVGTTDQGVWIRTELLSPTNAIPYADESEREFKNRVAALAKHAEHGQ